MSTLYNDASSMHTTMDDTYATNLLFVYIIFKTVVL